MCRVKLQQFFPVQKVIRVDPEDGIRRAVECCWNIHLSYELGENVDVNLDTVQTRHVCRPCMIIVDNERFVQEFGKTKRHLYFEDKPRRPRKVEFL